MHWKDPLAFGVMDGWEMPRLAVQDETLDERAGAGPKDPV